MNRKRSIRALVILAAITAIAALLAFGQLTVVARAQEGAPTAEPPPGATRVRETDGAVMVYVPAGEFLMGSPEGVGDPDERPQHRVYLDGFWIDRTEVTNAQYRQCVDAGSCTPPGKPDYWEDEDFGQPPLPVVWVDWKQSQAYCQWAGARLPTEAEWEKAARGTDGRTYPWGNDLDAARLNACDSRCECAWRDAGADDGYARTAPVGSFVAGASPFGALDMSGNVWEWVADWYGNAYYAESPAANPPGPDKGTNQLLRGGSWYTERNTLRATDRAGRLAGYRNNYVGFRCAVPASDLPAPVAAATPEPPTSIYFIGDSLSFELSKYFPRMATSGSTPIQLKTGESTIGASPLCYHLNFEWNYDEIAAGLWNVVVLEEDLLDRWPQGTEEYAGCARKFAQAAQAGHARIILTVPWLDSGVQSPTLGEITAVVERAGAELGAVVAPVGQAFERATQQKPDLRLTADDGDHPSAHGYYLLMSVLYATIFERDPQGLAYRMADMPADLSLGWGRFWQATDGGKITDDDAAFLQRIAWETVQEYRTDK